MPDSEHPSGDDSRPMNRRASDASTPTDRPARSSSSSRTPRSRPGSVDPRREGGRTPPRRTTRPSVVHDDIEDVASALARVPDANGESTRPGVDSSDAAMATRTQESTNGGSSATGTGRRPSRRRPAIFDPLMLTAEDSVDDEIEQADEVEAVEDHVTGDVDTEAEPQPEPEFIGVQDTVDTEIADTESVETVEPDVVVEADTSEVDTSEADMSELDTVEPEHDTVEQETIDEVTELMPIVESRHDTEILPVVEPETLPGDEPRIYDVELDEPGAYVALVPAVTEPADLPVAVEPAELAEAPAPIGPARTVVRRIRRRPRVRRVTRVVRHVDTWTVFKVAALFNLVLYAATLISGVLLWNVAHGTGTVDNVERFMESFGWETFEFKGQELFDNGWRIGLFLALGLTGLAVLAATTFNLITDIVGGIRVTVLEEEVVVAAPSSIRRRTPD